MIFPTSHNTGKNPFAVSLQRSDSHLGTAPVLIFGKKFEAQAFSPSPLNIVLWLREVLWLLNLVHPVHTATRKPHKFYASFRNSGVPVKDIFCPTSTLMTADQRRIPTVFLAPSITLIPRLDVRPTLSNRKLLSLPS